jgi:D-lyxose ketol-isomerase
MKINVPLYPTITIDESMVSYKGKISFKQYNKHKNKSFGIQFFTKVSSDKEYFNHLLPYTGKILIMII